MQVSEQAGRQAGRANQRKKSKLKPREGGQLSKEHLEAAAPPAIRSEVSDPSFSSADPDLDSTESSPLLSFDCGEFFSEAERPPPFDEGRLPGSEEVFESAEPEELLVFCRPEPRAGERRVFFRTLHLLSLLERVTPGSFLTKALSTYFALIQPSRIDLDKKGATCGITMR